MNESVAPSLTDDAQPGQGEALVAQGRVYYAQGQYQEALSCLHMAYDSYLSGEASAGTDGASDARVSGEVSVGMDGASDTRVAEIANDIGVVYTVLERWPEAEKWLDEAQQRFVRGGDLGGEAQALGNMGSMYRVRGLLGQAAAHLQLSADKFHVVGDDERRVASLRSLSVVRLRQFRPLQAVACYRDALACHPNPNWLVRLLKKLFGLPFRLLRQRL
jgi:tetratricopeptide (TPR) repeat protein